jgi:hypothetical protein
MLYDSSAYKQFLPLLLAAQQSSKNEATDPPVFVWQDCIV